MSDWGEGDTEGGDGDNGDRGYNGGGERRFEGGRGRGGGGGRGGRDGRRGDRNGGGGYGDRNGGGGYGDRNGGGGFGGGYGERNGNRGDDDDNDGSNVTLVVQDTDLRNDTLDFIPKDFKKANVAEFLKKMPELIKRANLLQMYALQKYIIQAYEFHLKAAKQHDEAASGYTSARQTKAPAATQVGRRIHSQVAVEGMADDDIDEAEIEAYWRAVCTNDDNDTEAFAIADLEESVVETNIVAENATTSPQAEVNIIDLIAGGILEAIDMPHLPELVASTPNEINLSLRKSAETIAELKRQRRLTHTLPSRQRLTAKQTTASSGAARTPAPHATPLRALMSKRVLSEQELMLREPLKCRVFAKIMSLPACVHNEQTSSFAYFPLHPEFYEAAACWTVGNTNACRIPPTTTNISNMPHTTTESNSSDFLGSITMARQNVSAATHQSLLSMAPPPPLPPRPSLGPLSFSVDISTDLLDNLGIDVSATSMGARAAPTEQFVSLGTRANNGLETRVTAATTTRIERTSLGYF